MRVADSLPSLMPGQRRGAQARRQDRRGGAGQAPGGDQEPGRADRQGPGEDRGRGARAAARPTCRPAPCSSRWARPSATSTPRPPGLKKALRQPQTRGQWGELQLRRCIEIAGMTEHVDFELQETLHTEDGRLRPDARFLLPEGRSFVADSKVPLDAFLDAQEAEIESRAPGPPGAPRAAGPRARPRAQLEGLPGPVQGRRDAGPGDLLHPQRAGPARRLRRRPDALRLRPGAQRAAGQPDLADRAAADDGAGLAPGADGRRGGRDRRGGGTLHARFAKFLGDFDKVGRRPELGDQGLRRRRRLDGAAAAAAAAQGRGARHRPRQGDRAAGAGRDHRARDHRAGAARGRRRRRAA